MGRRETLALLLPVTVSITLSLWKVTLWRVEWLESCEEPPWMEADLLIKKKPFMCAGWLNGTKLLHFLFLHVCFMHIPNAWIRHSVLECKCWTCSSSHTTQGSLKTNVFKVTIVKWHLFKNQSSGEIAHFHDWFFCISVSMQTVKQSQLLPYCVDY